MIYVEMEWRLLHHVLLTADIHKFIYAGVFIVLVFLGAATKWPRLLFGTEWPLAYLIWPTMVISAMYLYAGTIDYLWPLSHHAAPLGWPIDAMFAGIIAFCLAFVKIKSLRVGRFVASICSVLYIWAGFLTWLVCATAVVGGRI